MSEVFAKKDLLDRVDGDTEFLEETVAMLDEDCPALIEKIRTAVASNDSEELAYAAHTLKGMLANFCAEPAESAALELEMMGREGQLASAEAARDQVQRETGRLQEALHEFLRVEAKSPDTHGPS
jgi:two-component system sensor histidine kinase/response regulator